MAKNGDAPRSKAPSKTPGSTAVMPVPINQPSIARRTTVRTSWMALVFLAPKRLTAAKPIANANEIGPAGASGKYTCR